MWVTGVKSTEGYINNLYQQRAIFTKTCERKRPDTVTSSYKKKHACFFPTDFLFHFMLMWCYHFPWLAFASFIVMYSSFFQVPLWCASYFASSIEACFLVLHYDILLVFFPHCHCEVLLVFTSFYDIEAEGPVQEIYFASESQSGSLSLRSVQEPLRCDVCIDNMYTWVWNALVMVGRTTEKNQESYLVLSSPCILRYG